MRGTGEPQGAIRVDQPRRDDPAFRVDLLRQQRHLHIASQANDFLTLDQQRAAVDGRPVHGQQPGILNGDRTGKKLGPDSLRRGQRDDERHDSDRDAS